MPWEAPPIKAPGSWVWWSYKIMLEITHSAKLRPKDVLRTSLKDVLWTSPYGPLCIAKGFPLPTSWGRISVTLLMCSWSALFVAYCNIVIASWETGKERLSYRKRYIEEFVWGIPLFWLHALLFMSFCCFLRLLAPPSQVMYLRNSPYEDI